MPCDRPRPPSFNMKSTQPTTFNVREAGAKGDGASDDTAVFQRLLDLAGECGGTVHVPPGEYRVGSLRMRSHTSLAGSPAYGWRESAGSVLVLADPEARCLLDITLAIGVHIDGLCLDGRGLGGNIHGILVDKPDYGVTEDSPVVDRCKVTGFTGDGIRLSRIWCFRIRSTMSGHNGGNGLSVRGWDGFVLDNWLSVNDGAGFATIGENNAVTMTGNRIEWNKRGGIVILNGSHYNITGNYLDRCGPGLRFEMEKGYEPKPAIVGRVGYSTVTGNIFYRSGRPEWADASIPESSAHVVLRGARGISMTGNTLVAGQDDESESSSFGSPSQNWSPRSGMILERLRYTIIADNVLDSASTKELIRDLGGHGPGVVQRDNPGEILFSG